MRADRPMNEYEAAAIWGLCTVCECLIDQGVLPAEPLLWRSKRCAIVRLKWARERLPAASI